MNLKNKILFPQNFLRLESSAEESKQIHFALILKDKVKLHRNDKLSIKQLSKANGKIFSCMPLANAFRQIFH